MRRIVGAVAVVVGAAMGCRSNGRAGASAGAGAGASASASAGASASASASAGASASASAGASAGAGAGASASAGAEAGVAANAMMARAHVAGVGYAAVTRQGEVVVDGAGLADVAQGSGVNADTVFEAASIAKLIVATCVLQLVEEGKIDLDAEASKYLGFRVHHPRSATPITVRMLLAHRASIRDRQDEIGAARDGQPLLAFLGRMMLENGKPRGAAFLETAPDTATVYSNVGASLAALAVQRVAGASFEEVSARRVFEPLRMRSTHWIAPDVHLASTGGYGRPYAYADAGFAPLPPPSHALYPAVDLHASAHDLARFARAMLRGGELDGARVLTGATVDTMMTAVTGDPQQALAWQLRSIGGAHVAGHEGEDAGATTALFLDRAANTGAVVIANGDAFGSDDPARAAAVQTFLGELLAIAALATSAR